MRILEEEKRDFPCHQCLKLPVCKQLQQIKCDGLSSWLLEFEGTDETANRINNFEMWWNRDVSVIVYDIGEVHFKKQKDHYQTMICKYG